MADATVVVVAAGVLAAGAAAGCAGRFVIRLKIDGLAAGGVALGVAAATAGADATTPLHAALFAFPALVQS